MKKRLFAAVVSLFFYIIFVVSFSMADNSGQIPQVLSKVGLTNNFADAQILDVNLIDPTPDPRRPKGNLIDPTPDPRRPKIDPTPDPRRPK